MKNVIVTGANGFIGKQLVLALAQKGYQVYALARHFDEELKLNSNVACIDVSDGTTLNIKKKLPNEDYSCMFHLAWGGTSGPTRANYHSQLKNVEMTCDYVLLCKELGCPRMYMRPASMRWKPTNICNRMILSRRVDISIVVPLSRPESKKTS